MEYNIQHPNRHAIFRLIPGVSCYTYVPDTMHCKNLGSDPMFLGSVLRYSTHYFLPDSPDENLKRLNIELKEEMQNVDEGKRYKRINQKMIHAPGKKLPCLIERKLVK